MSDDSEDRVDADDVRHVADLARIELDDSAVDDFTEAFAEILDYFATLDEVDEDVTYSEDHENVMRADEVEDSLSREDAIRNAPETEDGYVRGPKVS